MKILVGYGIRPQTASLILLYWFHLLMVNLSGKYYGTPFQVLRRVLQGGPLSPTILNMLVYVVIWHWVALVTGEESVPERFGKTVHWLEAFLIQLNKVLELMIFISALITKPIRLRMRFRYNVFEASQVHN